MSTKMHKRSQEAKQKASEDSNNSEEIYALQRVISESKEAR